MRTVIVLVMVTAAAAGADSAGPLGPPVPGQVTVVSADGATPAGGTVEAEPTAVGDPEAEVVTLLDAIEAALVDNPDIGLSREAIRKASGQRQSANGATLPPLTFTYTELWQQQTKVQFPGSPAATTIAPGNLRSFTLGSDWVVFAGGALRANQAIARIAEVAARHNLDATINDVLSRTVSAYLQVLRAAELRRVTDRTVELARQQVKVANDSFEAGAVPKVNVLRAEAALQNALQAQLGAGNGIELSLAALNQVMGRSQLKPLRVAPLPRRLADPPDLLESLKTAVVRRPELRAAQKAIDINQEAVRAARAGYYPSFTVSSNIERSMNTGAFGNDDSFQVVGVFRLNLWDWFQTAGKVRAAASDMRAQRHRLEQAMQGIELQVRRAVLQIDEARQRVEAAQAEVDASRQALEIEQLRYTVGENTYLDLLDARRAASEAEANLVTAYYDNALAEADWLAATGSYLGGDGRLDLPQDQHLDKPEEYRSRGKSYDELLADYGLDAKAVEAARKTDGK